jgi:hypothetical protein
VARESSPLGRRLRALRSRWPGQSVRQLDIAMAFGTWDGGNALSLTAVSGWETGREVPTIDRVASYARFFASRRTMPEDEGNARLLSDEELTEQEKRELKDLEVELLALREQIITTIVAPEPVEPADAVAVVEEPHRPPAPRRPEPEPEPPRFWQFPDHQPIFIIGSKVLDPMLLNHPYANPRHPNHMPLMLFADGLALVELFGHLRMENPDSEVRFKTHDQVDADDLSGHVVVIGGGDVNPFAEWFSDRMEVPVAGASTTDQNTRPTEEAAFTIFEKDANGNKTDRVARSIPPVIDGTIDVQLRQAEGPPTTQAWPNLTYDIALLARQPNPLNTTATATLCGGLYGNGTYGVVRTFTDARLRDANESYRLERFGDSEEFYMLIRVLCNSKLGVTTTPDLNRRFTRLLEWPE